MTPASRDDAGARIPPGVPVVQCAANFSEGRDASIIASIAEAAGTAAGAVVADVSSDPDHNRSVVSLLGPPDAIRNAVVCAASEAARRMDLRRHRGVHPRMGVVDVVPFTPIRRVSMAECVALAEAVGEAFADDLGIPIYYYERSARPGRPVALPAIRSAVGAVPGAPPSFAGLAPDLGPVPTHRLGAVVVGARDPLVAYNIGLAQGSVTHAKRAAVRIRRERELLPCLSGVRALGLFLASRGLAQVSMNVTRPHATPIPGIRSFVETVLRELGARAGDGEIVGLVPRISFGGMSPQDLGLSSLRANQVIETWTETSE